MNNHSRWSNTKPQIQHQKINYQIQSPTVRVISADGTNHGVMNVKDAIRIAESQGLDLVELTGTADPPVAKIVDYNKFLYEQKLAKKEHDRRMRENTIVTKEIQLRPVTNQHDIAVKLNHAKEFLEHDHKIKLVVKFRGRESSFSQKGFEVINQFIEGLQPCKVEKLPSMAGNTIIAMIGPDNQKKIIKTAGNDS